MERQVLSSEELSEVLRRAQEIEATGSGGTDLEAYVTAAEEAGISREATMQALRERLGYPLAATQSGETVFARSADGHFYAAKVEQVNGQMATVRFLNGAEVKLPLSDLRELNLTPGRKLSYMSKDMSMWVNGQVVTFNAQTQKVEIENWGSKENVSLDKVRLLSQDVFRRASNAANLWAMRLWWLAGGIGLGFLIERFVLH